MTAMAQSVAISDDSVCGSAILEVKSQLRVLTTTEQGAKRRYWVQ
jgi:hypothetical protein